MFWQLFWFVTSFWFASWCPVQYLFSPSLGHKSEINCRYYKSRSSCLTIDWVSHLTICLYLLISQGMLPQVLLSNLGPAQSSAKTGVFAHVLLRSWLPPPQVALQCDHAAQFPQICWNPCAKMKSVLILFPSIKYKTLRYIDNFQWTSLNLI